VTNHRGATAGAPSKEEVRARLVTRAAALRPMLREHAGRGEADRVVPAQVVDALGEAGVFRLPSGRSRSC